MRQRFWIAFALVLFLAVPAAAQPVTVFHDPWLNWDFVNRTGVDANMFCVIVETPNWGPPEVYFGPFAAVQFHHGDNNGDGVPDTMLRWFGATVPSGAPMHVGAYMLGSGRILDAHFRSDFVKVGTSVPITYELTEIFDPDPVVPDNSEIHMLLQFAPGYYADPGNAGTIIGWDNIQTFANIPSHMLGLEDLDESLDSRIGPGGDLEMFKVDAREGGPGGELITGPIWIEPDFPPESFFDVYFDLPVPDSKLGPQYESLLVADVVMFDGVTTTVVGRFWNLNPQCPEPGTYALVGFGIAALVFRLRRKR